MPSAAPPSETAPACVAVSATFTAEPVRATLGFWFEQLGLESRVEFAPYNQVFQQLLDPASLLGQNRGVNLLLIRLDDWTRGGGPGRLEEVVAEFLIGLREAAARWHAPAIVALCPSSPGLLSHPEGSAAVARASATVASALEPLSGLHLVTSAELDVLYPVRDAHDPHADELGHVPYTPELFAALGTLLARRVAALRRPPCKLLVLDGDETLWRGVCAEDGPFGVWLDEDRRALQEFARAQRDTGMLLALCSKNEEEDVLDVFRSNPEMPLRIGDFAARRVDWSPKSENLASIAAELGLGLDSVVFVDDNETECAEVEASCPEVLTLALPREGVARFLRHVWAFDRPKATREDRERASLYAQNLERARLERRALSLEGFIEALDLQVRIAGTSPDELPRVAQLTQRTNQMNFTTVRRSEIDLRDLLRSGVVECLTVHVSDRFGGYGLVGAVLFRGGQLAPESRSAIRRGDALVIETFLLSCRALGKGVEHRMLARVAELACERGFVWLEAPFLRTARNRPALDFLRSIGGVREQPREGGLLFRLPARETAGLRYRPAAVSRDLAGTPERSAPGAAAAGSGDARAIDYGRIARRLSDPRRILEAVAHRQGTPDAAGQPAAAPRSPLERELVQLWSELLRTPRIGVHDGFFDLGGHSLLAVQLISRVRRLYAVDLSLELVYAGTFTVAELAKAIEVAQIEKRGVDDYAAALAEVESLSDEEARALLEREKAGSAGD